MIEQELIGAFSQLNINEKRNQISAELEKLGLLLDTVHQEYNIQKLPSSLYAYNKATNKNMSNEEYFNKMYENIIFIRKDVLTLVNTLMKSKSPDANSKTQI